MALSAKQVQKKREKKKAKRRERKAAVSTAGLYDPGRLPLHECLVQGDIFETGVGHILLARRRPDGHVIVGAFLIDVFCLGAKDAYVQTVPLRAYEDVKTRMNTAAELRAVAPSYARKLVEGAVAYARSAGLAPAFGYKDAAKTFGDIDAAECAEEFTFGKDGKPFFMNGPNDSDQRIKTVLGILESTCGKDGFHYAIGGPVERVPADIIGGRDLDEEDEGIADGDEGDEDDMDGDDTEAADPAAGPGASDAEPSAAAPAAVTQSSPAARRQGLASVIGRVFGWGGRR